jgi:mutual gliding-motility protein MglA
MALFNYATKEITIKIVYYGPGLSGKTTNLQYLHSIFDPAKKGKLLSLATESDRTLFFDFLPLELGKISEFSVRFQLYTVPGQVRYNATRKLVLKGADAIVFVADSQHEMRDQNLESLKNMGENLIANNINPEDIPVIFQYNKRDLPNIMSVEDLNRALNGSRVYDYREAVAIEGKGVEDTFKAITKLVINRISEKYRLRIQPADKHQESAQEEHSPGQVPTENFPQEPVIEFDRFDERETEQTKLEILPLEQAVAMPSESEKETAPAKEDISKEIREVPVIPADKLILIVNNVNEITQTLMELKNIVSSVHSEMKDIRKDQKDISSRLREMSRMLEDIKTKKRWFRL